MRHKSSDQQNSAHYILFSNCSEGKGFTSDQDIPNGSLVLTPISASPSLEVHVCTSQTSSQHFVHNNFLEHPGFSIRAGGRRNSPAISRQLAAYFENK